MTATTPTAPPRQSRAWLGYFVALITLGVTAILAPVIYNNSIQLRPEQIAAARQLWQQAGPRDYEIDYRVKRYYPDPRADEYRVVVRDGRAVRVFCNGQAQVLADASAGLAVGLAAGLVRDDDAGRQTVEGIFDHLDNLVGRTQGRASSKRDYCTGQFDAATGYPTHFIHRIAGTHQRQEWTVRVTPR